MIVTGHMSLRGADQPDIPAAEPVSGDERIELQRRVGELERRLRYIEERLVLVERGRHAE